jgi:flagellar hook-associated protein 2
MIGDRRTPVSSLSTVDGPSTGLNPVNPTWQAVKASSSSTAVTATATTGASASSTTFTVSNLAKTEIQRIQLNDGDQIASGSTLSLTVGTGGDALNSLVPVEPTDTIEDVARTINSLKFGVTASIVNTDQGKMLQLAADKPGAANAFSITGFAAGPTSTLAAGSDAKITVGDPLNGGYTVSSTSNTFTNVIPGVTFTATDTASNVTVTVAPDPGSIADKMQALIDAANGALTQIGTSTAYNPSAKTGGPLSGDYTVRQLQANIMSGVSNGASDYGSFKQFGVQLDSTGKLKFDKSAFLDAYAKDPVGVQTATADGFAKAMEDIADKATNSTTGSLTTAIQSRNTQVKELNDRISDWDVRLDARQNALQRQYSALEVALGKLKNQSTWLAGQLAGLSTSSSS